MKKKTSYSKIDPKILEVVNLSKENNYTKALILGKRLLGKFDTNEVLLNTIGIIYRRLGKFKKAEFWHERAISIKNDFWAAHLSLGSIYYDRGDVQKAISKYKSILERNPNYIEARGNLALALKTTGRYEAAITEYEHTFKVIRTSVIEFHMAATLLTLTRFEEGGKSMMEADGI